MTASQFAPPPKHVNYHGAAAAGPSATTPDTRGWGAPLPQETIAHQQHIAQAEQRAAAEEEEAEKPPPGPYRVDTTGLSTANLPKPPVRRLDASSPAPPSRPTSAATSKAAPRLPPRLPPRQNSRPDLNTPEPPPSYNEAATYQPPDQGALGRLGHAGVSVPGFDIGRTASPPVPARSPQPTPPGRPQAAQVNELQSRFAKMTAQSSSAAAEPQAQQQQSQGTTWAQKQSAMNTASNLHKNPSSVSFSDARGAASTANNFRERHGEQVQSGMQQAKGMSQKYGQQAKDMNQKYGISNKLSGYATSAKNFNRSSPSPAGAGAGAPAPAPAPAFATASPGLGSVAAAKKAPPPPPPKKRELGAASTGSSDLLPPPPVPVSSKPR